VPKSRLMNTVCEDSGELASNAVEVDLLKSPANSGALASEDRLETWSYRP